MVSRTDDAEEREMKMQACLMCLLFLRDIAALLDFTGVGNTGKICKYLCKLFL